MTAVLFISASQLSGEPESMRARHRQVAVYWQDRQIAKDAAGPPPTPRAPWRDAPWAWSIQQWDHDAFHAVNGGWANPFFDRAMPVLTHLGDTLLHVALLFGLLVWAIRRHLRAYRHTALIGFIGVALGLIPLALKDIIPRYRPPTLYPYEIVLLGQPLYGSSFPSGHTFAVFCLATIFACRHRWTAPWGFGLAALVGLSRVSVGVHWPLDVIAGAILGTVSGYFVTAWWARRYSAFPETDHSGTPEEAPLTLA